MSDIVERLREAHPNSAQRFAGSNIMLDAAAEIERLRRELAEARAGAFREAAEIAYAICSRDKTAVRLQLLIVDVLRAKAGEGR